jgi:hypothetical protein
MKITGRLFSKHRWLRLTPGLSEWVEAWEFALLTSSWVIVMLQTQEPCFENHWGEWKKSNNFEREECWVIPSQKYQYHLLHFILLRYNLHKPIHYTQKCTLSCFDKCIQLMKPPLQWKYRVPCPKLFPYSPDPFGSVLFWYCEFLRLNLIDQFLFFFLISHQSEEIPEIWAGKHLNWSWRMPED